MKRNSTERKALAATSVFLGVILASTSVVSGAWAESCSTNYPSRYMGGEADIIKAPNGALIYDKALEAVGQIVYTEPTVENLGDGIWVIGGYSIANCFVIEAPEGLIVYDKRAYPGAEARDVVRPNLDTLYSQAQINLMDEPVVIMLQVMRKPSPKSTK